MWKTVLLFAILSLWAVGYAASIRDNSFRSASDHGGEPLFGFNSIYPLNVRHFQTPKIHGFDVRGVLGRPPSNKPDTEFRLNRTFILWNSADDDNLGK